MGEGGAKAEKNFPQDILNKKIYSYGFCPEKIYAQGRKKKFHLTCPKTNLPSLKIPTPSPPLRITQAPEIYSTKTWNPETETETETEYAIRERRFQAID